jgi:hypothetical protein
VHRQSEVNPIFIDPCRFDFPFSPVDPVTGECDRTVLTDAQFPVLAEHEAAVNGAFKTPTLRNAELIGPYMHNGGMKSLREVVDFYNRGDNFNNFGLDADIEPIGMTNAQKVDLVNFLRALTDPRVRQEQGPFDHPSLRVFQGHPGNQNAITQTQIITVTNPDGTTTQRVVAADSSTVLPAVGNGGRPAKGLPQLGTFLNQ